MDRAEAIFNSLASIEKALQENLTIDRLADSIHFSKYHYQRLFRETVGDSVMRYVTRRRLTLAAGELSYTRNSILDIALRYGFSSHEGFSRSFKAYMGETPSEYRRRHACILPNQKKKECGNMLHTFPAGKIIQELNHLIKNARETAEFLRRHAGGGSDAAALYVPFWSFTAAQADIIADELAAVLKQVTAINSHPDGISARFVLIRAVETAALRSRIIAFQAELTVSRAIPEHRPIFQPFCERCNDWAQATQLNTEKLATFFQELAAMIFQDMRQEASQMLLAAAEAGRAAIMPLSPVPIYSYIVDELQAIIDVLSSKPLEEITVSLLEDLLFQLDAITFSVQTDVLRAPQYQPLFGGIPTFRTRLGDAVDFFQSLSAGFDQSFSHSDSPTIHAQTTASAAWENLLLVHLKGELQKLEKLLSPSQHTALNEICSEFDTAIQSARRADNRCDPNEHTERFRNIYTHLACQAEQLGPYGGPLQFIAEKIKHAVS